MNLFQILQDLVNYRVRLVTLQKRFAFGLFILVQGIPDIILKSDCCCAMTASENGLCFILGEGDWTYLQHLSLIANYSVQMTSFYLKFVRRGRLTFLDIS